VPNVSYAVEGSVEDIIFTIFMGITTVVFAFAFTLIAPDIQGTLAAKPEPRREMMKGVSMAYVFTFFAYFLSAISGYYAFGNAVSGDVLLSIAEYATTPAERGAITAAQVMVCIHVTVAYQVRYTYE
jgi:amino acid permease